MPAPLVLPAPSPPAPTTTQGSTFTTRAVSQFERLVVLPFVSRLDSCALKSPPAIHNGTCWKRRLRALSSSVLRGGWVYTEINSMALKPGRCMIAVQSAPGHGDLYKVTKGARASVTAIQTPSAPPSPSGE